VKRIERQRTIKKQLAELANSLNVQTDIAIFREEVTNYQINMQDLN